MLALGRSVWVPLFIVFLLLFEGMTSRIMNQIQKKEAAKSKDGSRTEGVKKKANEKVYYGKGTTGITSGSFTSTSQVGAILQQ